MTITFSGVNCTVPKFKSFVLLLHALFAYKTTGKPHLWLFYLLTVFGRHKHVQEMLKILVLNCTNSRTIFSRNVHDFWWEEGVIIISFKEFFDLRTKLNEMHV